MAKYSLKWWYETGAIYRAQGNKNDRVSDKFLSHLSFLLGYKFGKWNPAPEGDFRRIVNAKK